MDGGAAPGPVSPMFDTLTELTDDAMIGCRHRLSRGHAHSGRRSTWTSAPGVASQKPGSSRRSARVRAAPPAPSAREPVVSQNRDKTDPELIDACRAGRQDAWEEVVRRYERLAFSIPLNYGLSHTDAADIAQFAFSALVEHLDRLRPDSNLGAWLATVARRQAFRVLRSQQRERLGQEEDIGDSPFLLHAAAADTSHAWERVEWLNQGLSRLDQRCQKLLLRLYFSAEQPAYEVVAEELGLRVGSIGPIRGRCLARLRALLLEQGD